MKKDYVLAMYDIRGKQEFIYRSVKLKEIVGGSAIIRDCFDDYFFDAAKAYRNEQKHTCDKNDKAIEQYDPETQMDFKFSEFENRMNNENGQYIGEVVYCGGGNFLVLFKNEEACKEVTYRFTREVIRNTSTLRVVCTYIKDLNPDCYHSNDLARIGDYDRLYSEHRFNENQETTADPYWSLPIVQTDYLTSQPLVQINVIDQREEKLTKEQSLKHKKYREEWKLAQNPGQKTIKNVLDENELDKMVKEKGKDSMLAVIHIDGNNMGARVQKCFEEESYDACITRLRKLSKEIQEVCIDDRLEELDIKRRVVVDAGDDFTIICNAHDAWKVACTYLKNLPEEYSSCVGIAIFHSHTPFSDVYRIAEECCESGKKKIREQSKKDPTINSKQICMLDFHYCQGAIGLSLDDIRAMEHHQVTSLPWQILRQTASAKTAGNEDQKHEEVLIGSKTNKDAERVRKNLDLFGRSNVKGLLEPAQYSEAAFMMEIRRIISHMSSDERKALDYKGYKDIFEFCEANRWLIRDLIIAYDIGFGLGEKNNESQHDQN